METTHRTRLSQCTKMWQLLEIAIQDLKKAEKRPNVEIYMYDWVSTNMKSKVCSVCLAGACLIEQAYPEGEIPYDFEYSKEYDEIWANYVDWYDALDDIRMGRLQHAYDAFYYGKPPWMDEVRDSLEEQYPVISYHENKEHFYKCMDEIMVMFKEMDI